MYLPPYMVRILCRPQITQIRENWAETANYYLKKNDIKARITHKSFKELGWEDQGVKPTIRLNIIESSLEKKGIRTEKGDYNRKVKLERKIGIIDKKLFKCKAHLAKLFIKAVHQDNSKIINLKNRHFWRFFLLKKSRKKQKFFYFNNFKYFKDFTPLFPF